LGYVPVVDLDRALDDTAEWIRELFATADSEKK
jgi:nucleoside-diphosphate-sugar epimerase